MNYQSLKWIIEGSRLPSDTPVIVPRAQQQQHMKDLLQELTAAGIQAHDAGRAQEPTLVVDIDPQRRLNHYYQHLYLSFSKDEVRQIDANWSSAAGTPLSSVDQLKGILRKAEERIALEHARNLKRAKIRRLKERSIETQVEELARRLKFSYALEPMHTKLKLYVRINIQDTVVVDIPLKTLQESIDRLESLLASVRELAEVGLRFQMTRTAYVRNFKEPDSAQDDLDLDDDADEEDAADEGAV